jgi:uncharacterized membrane protein YeaQ/YmgE (transglycosylase-associated protein family)
VVLGALAGWIATIITASKHGIIEDLILGIIGAFVGGFVMNYFGQQGVTGFDWWSLGVAVVGAVMLIIIGRVFHR